VQEREDGNHHRGVREKESEQRRSSSQLQSLLASGADTG
jgi:hypothetical protein